MRKNNNMLTADRRPQTADRRPQTADRRPQTADRRPQTADRRPQTADRRPQTADRRPQTNARVARIQPPAPPYLYGLKPACNGVAVGSRFASGRNAHGLFVAQQTILIMPLWIGIVSRGLFTDIQGHLKVITRFQISPPVIPAQAGIQSNNHSLFTKNYVFIGFRIKPGMTAGRIPTLR